MHTIVLYGGHYGNNHFRKSTLPKRIEIYYKVNVVECFELSKRNQDLSDNVVYDVNTRKPVDSDWKYKNGWIRFVGELDREDVRLT